MKVTRIKQPPSEVVTRARVDCLPDDALFVHPMNPDVVLIKTNGNAGTLVACVCLNNGQICRFTADTLVRLVGYRPLQWWAIKENSDES
jgi:hypothetical protein